MRRPDNNGSRMMLTELIFSIFFFMVIVAVCIQLFAGAFIAQKESRQLAIAVNICASEADRYIATGNKPEDKYFDSQGEEASFDDASYVLSSDVTKESAVEKMVVTFTNLEDESDIYSLEVERGL